MNQVSIHPPSLVFREAQADARNLSRDVLEAGLDLFESIANESDGDPFERFNASERLRAFIQERDRRDRVDRLTPDQTRRRDRDREAWGSIRDLVKGRVSVPDVLQLAGVPLRRAGTSRGREEFCGPCPLCGGEDRLRAWSGPAGRLWCRQCRWSTDVIGAASLLAGDDFHDCVKFLAERAGLAVPR